MGYRRQMAWSLVGVAGTLMVGSTVVVLGAGGGNGFFLLYSVGPALVVLLAGLTVGIKRPRAFHTCLGWGVLSYAFLLLLLWAVIPWIAVHLYGPWDPGPLLPDSWGIFPWMAVHLLFFSWPAPILQVLAGAMVAWFWQHSVDPEGRSDQRQATRSC